MEPIITFQLWDHIFSYCSKDDESSFLLSMSKRMRDDWFGFMTRQCNKEQKDILWNILFTFKNMMILGEPGTGKTYLLKLANKLLTKLQVPTQVCAFTGLAGQQADGATLHRIFPFFRFKNPKDWNKDVGCPTFHEVNNSFIPLHGVLFIDEISMVSPVLFEQLMYFQKNASPKFRVIVMGDFWQLPPIESTLNEYTRKFFFQNHHIHKMEIFELTIPQRHCDPEFLSHIRAIRKNDYNPAIMDFLKQRKLAFDFLNPIEKRNKLYLFHDNKRVDAHNIQFLALLKTPLIQIPFEVRSIYTKSSYQCGTTKITNHKSLFEYQQNNQQAFTDLPELQSVLMEQQVKDVGLKIGCHIMFNKNIYQLLNCSTPEECQFYKKCIHTKDECIDIFNGTRAIVLKIWPDIGLLVELQDKKTNLFFPLMDYQIEISSKRTVGLKIGRYVHVEKGLMKNSFGKILEMDGNQLKIDIKRQEIKIKINKVKPVPRIKKLMATVVYYPIVLSYALTIQKSQGMTLDNVVLSLQYMPSPYLVTVAISRCRTAQGVFINGDFRKPQGQIDPLIVDFTKQIKLKESSNKRKFTMDLKSQFNQFQIKITMKKNNQFIVTSNLLAYQEITSSKSSAVTFIHNLCVEHIAIKFPDLLHLCTLPNIVSLLSTN